jgi:hypothetical protein
MTPEVRAEVSVLLLAIRDNADRITSLINEPQVEIRTVDQNDEDILARYKLTKRNYLEHARANDFPNEKIGRQVRTTTAALDDWIASCRRRPPSPRLVVNKRDDIQRDIEEAGRRLKRRLERRAR